MTMEKSFVNFEENRREKMNKMSKKLHIGIYGASLGVFVVTLAILILLVAISVAKNSNTLFNTALSFALSFGILGMVQFIIVHSVYNFLMLSKMWGAIQDGKTEITTGKAIGYLFIPVFNLYWIFKVWGNFPNAYKQFAQRQRRQNAKISDGVFDFYPIFLLLCGVLVFPVLILPFVFMFIISKTCDAVNALENAASEPQIQMMPNQIQNRFAAGV